MNKVMIFSAIFAIVSVVMTAVSLSSCEADEDYRIGDNYTLADALFTRVGNKDINSSVLVEYNIPEEKFYYSSINKK